MTTSRLDRFTIAQAEAEDGFDAALAEIRAGRKRHHWIWYIFPQLAGLGSSAFAQRYGIDGEAEAIAYLRDPVLRARLLAVATAAAEHLTAADPVSVDELMGSGIDATKLVSSLTLFRHVATVLQETEPASDYAELARVADVVLAVAAAQGYPPCRATLDRLTRGR